MTTLGATEIDPSRYVFAAVSEQEFDMYCRDCHGAQAMTHPYYVLRGESYSGLRVLSAMTAHEETAHRAVKV